jgi:hypothetical protein
MTNAKRTVSETLLIDKNWKIGAHDGVSSAAQMHYFYLTDFSLGHLQLLAIGREEFAKGPTVSIEQSVAVISNLMIKSNKLAITDLELSCLGAAVVSYLTQTATYKAWKDMSDEDETIHAIINIYRKGSTSHVNIRPAITRCDGILFDTEQVIDMSRQIRAVDMENRPQDQQAVRDNLPT